MIIREAQPEDWDGLWPIFQEVVSLGDTYAIDPACTKAEAFAIWMASTARTYLVEEEGTALGTYYIKPNHGGPGAHVCNCGYMVSARARGKGLATALCEHSQRIAREMGFQAMQFNLVVATNEGAVRLWERLGFAIVGTIPMAFRHPEEGLVAAHVMHKWLGKV